MNALSILLAARPKLAKGFCKFSNAKDATNVPVGSTSRAACKWCMWGALLSSSPLGSIDPALVEAAQYVARVIQPECQATTYRSLFLFVSGWNDRDERTKDEVLAAMDGAIAAALRDRDERDA